MYLEVKGVKKSYGKDTSYVQVLKGVSTGIERGRMCVNLTELHWRAGHHGFWFRKGGWAGDFWHEVGTAC